VKFLEGYVRQFPSSAELRTGLGLAYIWTGAEDKAVEEFGRAIELNPFVAEPYVHKAALMLSRNNPDEAIRIAGEGLKLANRADAHNVIGAAYGHKGDHSRALKHFLAAFKIYPDFPSLRDNIANAFMDSGDYHAAAEFCSKSQTEGKPCAGDTLKRINDRE
jgi:protein O-mannosyl-transferase